MRRLTGQLWKQLGIFLKLGKTLFLLVVQGAGIGILELVQFKAFRLNIRVNRLLAAHESALVLVQLLQLLTLS